MRNQTQKDRAEKKVQIAIDKIMDLKSDFVLSDYTWHYCERVLDMLRELESRVYNEELKKD